MARRHLLTTLLVLVSSSHRSGAYDTPMSRRFAVKKGAAAGAVSASYLWTRAAPPPAPAVAADTPAIPTWTLQNGVEMPILALNTVGLDLRGTERALNFAVSAGIRHVDFHPGTERDGCARFIKSDSSVRKDLFLTTKIRKAPPGTSPEMAAENVRKQIDEDLLALGVSHTDMLMLRDSPDPLVIQSQWTALESAMKSGKTRAIGVVNFCRSALTTVLETAMVPPAVNYYMLHVGMGANAGGLRSFGERLGVRTFAYGAVGEPGPSAELLTSPIVGDIAVAHGRSPEEVALRWNLQHGVAVSVRPTLAFGLGKSACDGEGHACMQGLQRRAESFTWALSKKEMATLDALKSPDGNPTLFSSAGCPGAFVFPPVPSV